MNDKYVESSLNITVVPDVSINQTKIECLIDQLGYDTVNVPVNISGILTLQNYNGKKKDLCA